VSVIIFSISLACIFNLKNHKSTTAEKNAASTCIVRKLAKWYDGMVHWGTCLSLILLILLT